MEKNNSFDLKKTIMECFTFIISFIIAPFSTLKNKLTNYSDFKSAGVLVLFIAICKMIINLIGTIISVVFVKQRYFFSNETKLDISFSNLKNLDYFSLVFKDIFFTLVVVAAVAGIYHIVAMIMKKSTNYYKLSTITATCLVPIVVSSFVSIIIGYIYLPLGVFITFAGVVYSLLVFIYATDNEVNFKNVDYKIYFHTICLTVTFIVAYYVLNNMLSSFFDVSSLFK